MKVELLDEAKQDLLEGNCFYEKQSAGLGARFLTSLFSEIDSLPDYASIHRVINGSCRCLAKRFPFAIYYRVEKDVIRVRAILDCRRDPASIQRRLEKQVRESR